MIQKSWKLTSCRRPHNSTSSSPQGGPPTGAPSAFGWVEVHDFDHWLSFILCSWTFTSWNKLCDRGWYSWTIWLYHGRGRWLASTVKIWRRERASVWRGRINTKTTPTLEQQPKQLQLVCPVSCYCNMNTDTETRHAFLVTLLLRVLLPEWGVALELTP